MALKNSSYDLDAAGIAAVNAARATGIAAARAGTPGLDASETAVLAGLCQAARGRGIGDLLGLILAEYYRAQGSQLYDREVALACAAVPGTLDETRATENS